MITTGEYLSARGPVYLHSTSDNIAVLTLGVCIFAMICAGIWGFIEISSFRANWTNWSWSRSFSLQFEAQVNTVNRLEWGTEPVEKARILYNYDGYSHSIWPLVARGKMSTKEEGESVVWRLKALANNEQRTLRHVSLTCYIQVVVGLVVVWYSCN